MHHEIKTSAVIAMIQQGKCVEGISSNGATIGCDIFAQRLKIASDF